MPSDTPDQIAAKSALYIEAEEAVAKLSATADVLVALELKNLDETAYDKARHVAAEELMSNWAQGLPELKAYARKKLSVRRTHHWALAFPEILENGGFDAFVGNPPFQGGAKLGSELGLDYRDYLVNQLGQGVRGQRGQSDLCAFMFLRAASLLASGGVFGLIATNTIAQGDTRLVGLDQICAGDGSIFRAVDSTKWPGAASLEVAIVWYRKGKFSGISFLNETEVSAITPYLTAEGRVTGNPYQLASNERLSFEGIRVEGTGFVLEDAEAAELIRCRNDNIKIIHRYLRGEDFNSRPDQSPAVWVISFGDWPLNRELAPQGYMGPVAEDFPECLAIVEQRVKPQRLALPPKNPFNISAAAKWWQFCALRPTLQAATKSMERVLFHSFTSKYVAFSFVPTNCIFAAPHNVFALPRYAHFALLQSNFHINWAWAFGSTLESRLRYTRSNCFETFPFPCDLDSLEAIGEAYFSFRKSLMLSSGEGLTSTYNRFHNPSEASTAVVELRQLHSNMDIAVAAAYGWQDLDLNHDFYETKQGIRFTISETARREALDRLLALNHQRHAEEIAAVAAQASSTPTKRGRKKKEMVGQSALEF